MATEGTDYVATTIRSHGELPAGVEVLVYDELDEGDAVYVNWLDAGRTLRVPSYCIRNED